MEKKYQFKEEMLQIHKKDRRDFSLAVLEDEFEVKNGFALEMFYLGGPYSENVFYIEKYDATVVAETDGNTVTCLDIFGGQGYSAEEIMSAFGCEKLVMGFTPKDSTGFDIQPINDEDTVLFVYSGGENIFSDKKLLFPTTAHT